MKTRLVDRLCGPRTSSRHHTDDMVSKHSPRADSKVTKVVMEEMDIDLMQDADRPCTTFIKLAHRQCRHNLYTM